MNMIFQVSDLGKEIGIPNMPGNTPIWIAAGVTAITGAAAFMYLRRRNRFGNQNEKVTKVGSNESASGSRGLRIPGLRKLIRERKMVFVVNRPLLSSKQLLFTSVSTACIRYYRSVINNREYYDTHVKPWTRTGQMKVVLKANTGEELKSILERCQNEHLEAIIMNVDDLNPNPNVVEPVKVKKANNTGFQNVDPSTPVVLCVLAPTDKLDQITGHLKLL